MGWWLDRFFFHNFFQTSFQNYLKLEVKEEPTNSPKYLGSSLYFLRQPAASRGKLPNLTTNPATYYAPGSPGFPFFTAKQATSTLYISDQGKYRSSSRNSGEKGKKKGSILCICTLSSNPMGKLERRKMPHIFPEE